MKIKCTAKKTNGEICSSENLDEGTTGKILCHDCKNFLMLVPIGTKFHT
jgi:hypothetical protein